MIAAISQLAKLAVCLFWGFFLRFAPILKLGAKWSGIISVCRILTQVNAAAALGMSFDVKFAASLSA